MEKKNQLLWTSFTQVQQVIFFDFCNSITSSVMSIFLLVVFSFYSVQSGYL